MNKLKKCLLAMMLLMTLTACAKFNGTLNVNKDGTFTISGELLIQKDMLDDQDLKSENLLNDIDKDLASHLSAEVIERNIDGIDYTGIAFKSDEAFSNDIVQIDQNDDKLTLIINQNLLSRIGIELDTLDDSDEGIALLESLGLDLKLQIKMPGTIISANYGDSFMQTVTLDLVDNIDSAFIVVSYVDNHVFYTFLAVAALIFAAILNLFYILYQASKKKKKTA